MNTLIVGLISAILAIIAYIVNAKVRDQEVETMEMLKMGTLGFLLGVSNILVLQQISGNSSMGSSTPEFLTGNPDF